MLFMSPLKNVESVGHFHEISYERYALGGHPKLVLSNVMVSDSNVAEVLTREVAATLVGLPFNMVS